jgi:hypothetical protein
MLTSRSALHPLAGFQRDQDEFRRLDLELNAGAVVKLEVLPWEDAPILRLDRMD